MRIYALMLVCATAVFLHAEATSAPAQTSAPPAQNVPHASQIITVNGCHASLNLSQTGGWYGGYPAYHPAYYPRYGPYYWPDVYAASYYQPPVTTAHPQLGIDYVNITPKTMTEIEFGLIVNNTLIAEVRDAGTFSKGAEIKHKFGISESIFPIHGIQHCVPLHVTFEDGTKWRNPLLPPKNQHMYIRT
jgi:hypothetical protein